MFRTASGLAALAILSIATGCQMCSHPFDHCGPVYDGPGCQSCSTRARAGSILSGDSDIMPSPEPAAKPTPAKSLSPTASRSRSHRQAPSSASIARHVKDQMQPGDVPGSERIVSVTDQVVESPENSADQPQVAVNPSQEPSQLTVSKGWTARRPTPELQR